MLEHVALNQTGFRVPGVAPDARGVLLGKQGAILLGSLDRLVAFLRLLSQEPLDDVLPSLHIYEVRSRLRAREYLLVLAAQSSYLMDRCARAAALCGGLLCTGSGKHYVKYRDRASPLGYDTAALSTETADIILYTDAFTQGYARAGEVPLFRLVHELSLQPVPGGVARDLDELLTDGDAEVLWVTAPVGLSRPLLHYLWRNRVRAEVCLLPEGELVEGARAEARGPATVLFAPSSALVLARIGLGSAGAARVLRLFASLPGAAVLRPVTDGVIVELGYRHPLRLESLAGLFDKERFYLFHAQPSRHSPQWHPRPVAGGAPRPGGCDVLLTPPPLLPVEALVEAHFTLDEGALFAAGPPGRRPAPLPTQQIALRLLPGHGRLLGRPRAILVPWTRMDWLKRLVYTLPPTLLKGYRAASIDEVGLCVVAERDADVLPLGTLLGEAAPGVFLPLGLEVAPRLSPEVLSEHLGASEGQYILLLPVPHAGGEPGGEAGGEIRVLTLPQSGFVPLTRRLLAPVVATPARRDPRVPLPRPPADATVVNGPVGALPLWGFAGGEDDEAPRALPARGASAAGEAEGDADAARWQG